MFGRTNLCRFGGGLVVTLSLLLAGAVSADEVDEQITRAVRVRLTDGRIVTGTVNERTDESELWLHFHHPNLQMSAAFRWDQVESAIYFGRQLDPDELYRLATQLKTSAPPPAPFHPRHGEDLSPYSTYQSHPHGIPQFGPRQFGAQQFGAQQFGAQRFGNHANPGRVTSLQAVARLAQWDADAAIDGLELHIQPLTIDGRILPVNGTISASLHAAVRSRYENERPTQELERWSEVIRAADFGPDGAIVRLPFRRSGPDDNLNISSNGRVQVRLGVSGHGAFDAQIPINIRNIDPFQDHQRLYRR